MPLRPHAARNIAAAAVVAWIVGAAAASPLGLWSGMGATAVLVGAGVLATQWRLLAPALVPTPRRVLVGLGAGLAMALTTHLVYRPVSALAPFVKLGTAQLYLQIAGRDRLLYAALLVPIAAAEELVWRGSVHAALGRRWGTAAAVLAGAFLYSLSHAPIGAPVLVLTALGCGLVWGTLRAMTGGLVAPIVAHIVWDELLLFVAPLIAG